MDRHGWSLGAPPDAEQRREDNCSAVFRNIDNVYRRAVPQRADPTAVPEEPAELRDGVLAGSPSADEIALEAPLLRATYHPRFCSTRAKEPSHDEMGEYMVFPNTQTPKRLGRELGSPSPQRIRTSDGDQEFTDRHCKSFRDVALVSDRAVHLNYAAAVNNALSGWPVYSDFYRMEACNMLLRHEVYSAANFANSPPGHTFTRTPNVDPLSRALAAYWSSNCGRGRMSHVRRNACPGDAFGGLFLRSMGTS